jgi:hypothetical protein
MFVKIGGFGLEKMVEQRHAPCEPVMKVTPLSLEPHPISSQGETHLYAELLYLEGSGSSAHKSQSTPRAGKNVTAPTLLVHILPQLKY